MDTLARLLQYLTPVDWAALALFVGGWAAYGAYADHETRDLRGLRAITHRHRLEWGRQMVVRDARIVDSSLIGNLMTSVSFYANTTIYIIAGLIAIAGTLDSLVHFTEELPFARTQAKLVLEAKIVLLIVVFIYAYFKFTWCLRQFNFLSILIGSAPDRTRPADELERHAQRFARLNTLAGDEFNRGIRSYYFGFAALGWFVHPLLFMLLTLAILLVLWRRDFRSQTMRALSG
jgi:uncharacterized membrane protein